MSTRISVEVASCVGKVGGTHTALLSAPWARTIGKPIVLQSTDGLVTSCRSQVSISCLQGGPALALGVGLRS